MTVTTVSFINDIVFIFCSYSILWFTKEFTQSFIVSLKVRIFPLNMRDTIIYVARWWEEYLLKRSLINHTCSWRDELHDVMSLLNIDKVPLEVGNPLQVLLWVMEGLYLDRTRCIHICRCIFSHLSERKKSCSNSCSYMMWVQPEN